MSKDDIAEELEAYADFLRLDGQEGRANGYEKAAQAVRKASYIPPNPARLNGIGNSTREAVIELENGVGIEELEDLREKYPWYDEFRKVKHIGPSRAQELHEKLNISTLDKLEMVANNGDLQMISGIGPKTAKKIKKSIEEVK